MVSTTHSNSTTRVSAQLPCGADTPGRRRSLRRQKACGSRPKGHLQTIARAAVVIASVLAFALLAADLREVVRGRAAVLGSDPEAALGLVLLGLATCSIVSPRPALRRAALVVSWSVGLYGLASSIGAPANTALLLGCLGVGIAAGHHHSRRVRWLADGLVIGGGVIALFALIARLFGSDFHYPLADRDPMAIAIAAIGFLLATGVILQRTDRGLGKLFDSDTSGGMLARRLVLVLVILPIGIARLAYLGIEAGAYDAAFAMSMGVMIGVASLAIVIVASAGVVDRLDKVRRGNEAQIHQMVSDLARQSKELQRSNRELESFSYSVSHDLRAPIRHIAGFSELLARVSGDKLDDKAKHYIAMIAEAVKQAGQLIDDLLEFSRMGRADLKLRELALDEVVRGVWLRLAPERAGRDIELHVAALPTVKADPAMLEVVIGNLLSNAVKYTARRTRAVIDVEARDAGDEVEISVRDNGVGFDMRYVDKLFEVFQRLHGDEFEGVGIGLANVKRIIERHGGHVRAEGEVERGATFHVSLPRAKDPSP